MANDGATVKGVQGCAARCCALGHHQVCIAGRASGAAGGSAGSGGGGVSLAVGGLYRVALGHRNL